MVERLRQRGDLGDDTAMALGVGLKLFGEVMLDNRQHPLFADFLPRFGEFIRHLKQGGKSRQEAELACPPAIKLSRSCRAGTCRS
ncbi:DUF3861 family protein [Azonexus sp. IMCC34839]|uniref:DUF3861 family protein n=1 Tax=Azonexus sp. IMCC34839 TaxID=3133695 RepID=UPI003999E1D3